MGLDLSLTSTGVCLSGNSFSINSKNKGIKRLIEISERILHTALLEKPHAIMLESYSFGSKFSRAHSIGELGGVVKTVLYQNGFAIIDVPPTCRAKFATGKGNASKTEVMHAISSFAEIEFLGASADDLCDAWILEQMGLAKLGLSKYQWSEIQLSSLAKIDWAPLLQTLDTKEQQNDS